MNDAQFDDQVRTARLRMAALRERAEGASDDAVRDLLTEGLEELAVAFEELRVAQEELHAQAEALAEAQVEMAAERDRYRDLFEFAPCGYFVTDAEGVIRQANRAACELLKSTPRYLTGKPLTVHVAAPDRGAFLTLLTALQKGEAVWEQTLRVQPRTDGPPRMVDLTVVPFRDPQTRTPMLRWQVKDAADRWLAEQQVRVLTEELKARPPRTVIDLDRLADDKVAAEKRLGFVADTSARLAAAADFDAVLRTVARLAVPALGDWCFVELADPDGVARRHPLRLAEAALGEKLRAAPAAPRPGRVVVIPDVAAPADGRKSAEARLAGLFAELGWSAGAWLPLAVGGEAVGGLAVGSGRTSPWAEADLTVAADFARQAAAALRAADLARRVGQADRAREEFVASLAHELRNPLTPILNAVRILELKGPADPQVERARVMIDRQARALNRLVEDLLDVTRVARGKIRLDVEPVDLGAAAEAAAEAARPRAAGREVALTVRTPKRPVVVSADPSRLGQVLAHLLDNAVKLTPTGGSVEVGVAAEAGRGVVRVRDTGPGIDRAGLASVFDLYAPGDRSADGGLGVGLCLVKRLVELHGGAVEVHSDGAGTGSTFTVRLPAAEPVGAELPAPPAPKPDGADADRVA